MRVSFIDEQLLNVIARYIVLICIIFIPTYKTQSCHARRLYRLCHENEEVTMISVKTYDNTCAISFS
jgi:hypothetical protein